MNRGRNGRFDKSSACHFVKRTAPQSPFLQPGQESVDFFAVSGGLQNSPCHEYGRSTFRPSANQTSGEKNGKRKHISSVEITLPKRTSVRSNQKQTKHNKRYRKRTITFRNGNICTRRTKQYCFTRQTILFRSRGKHKCLTAQTILFEGYNYSFRVRNGIFMQIPSHIYS